MAVLANWACLVEGMSASPQEVYQEIEEAFAKREVPELRLSRVQHSESGLTSARRLYLRASRKEFVFDICAAPFGNSFFFSWWMAIPPLPLAPLWTFGYLGIVLGLSAAIGYLVRDHRFAGGILPALPLAVFLATFVLTKLGIIFRESVVLRIPFIGLLYRLIFSPRTYYNADTQAMYEKSVHNAVLEAIDARTERSGVWPVPADERRPIRGNHVGGGMVQLLLALMK